MQLNLINAMTLPDRLRAETSRRVQSGVAFQVVALSFLGIAYGSEPDQSPAFCLFLGIASFLVVARGIAYLWLRKKATHIKKLYDIQMITASLTALAYGLMSADAILHYRTLNSPVVMMIFFSIGMATAVINTLAPSPNYQRIYFLVLAIPMIVAFFDPGLDVVFRNLGIIFTIYMAYLIYVGRAISKDLIAAYKSEFLALLQKDTLQKVIDLVPGFVALTDSQGAWTTTSHSFNKYRNSHAFEEMFKQFRQSPLNQFTREVTWYENGEENSYILSIQKFPDRSVLIVGIHAGEIFDMRKELDIQRTKAEFSARLATLGEMAGGIAHEVNNPLAVIIGICSQITIQLKQPQPDLTKIQEKVEKISKTSFRISKIITGLQSFSRQSDKDPFVPTKIKQIIDDTFELCREKFYQNSIQLNVAEIPEVEVPVRAVQISQVLINLLNNAFDAVKRLQSPVVSVSFEDTASDFFIRVSDSGPGIPKPVADRIFDPFFTTKDVGQGTGLGLSISRSILLDHQGDIILLKTEKHTTFQIRLPKTRKDKA